MQTGLILALMASVGFAAGIVIVRRAAAAAGESFSSTAASIFVAVPLFVIAISLAGDWDKFGNVSGRSLALLAITGIIHFIIGRLLGYTAFRLIGANKATPFALTNSFFTVVLSVIFLNESLTVYIILGVLCLFAGTVLISTEKKSVAEKTPGKRLSSNEVKGILTALGAAVCWGITPIFIKPSVEQIGSSAVGGLISYTTAAVVMGLLCLRPNTRKQLARLPVKQALVPMVVAAAFTSLGQLFFYIALGKAPADVVTPLQNVQIPMIFILSLIINRKIEVSTPKVALGMVATVAGTLLLFH
jgi:drug/metabolite transporter (DMT)-like permease